MIRPRLELALVHYPVLNRRGESIGSAITNLDLHDIARAARTYGVHRYWVITPFVEQQEMAQEIILYCERHDLIPRHLELCRGQRPNADWPETL